MGWHLIGNGVGEARQVTRKRIVRFNKPHPGPGQMIVSNVRDGGKQKCFEVMGHAPDAGLDRLLYRTARRLEPILSAWPSTGLVTLLALLSDGGQLSLSSMNLLPSIARPEELNFRTPLPCAFHNWLGERRVALPIISQLDWPDFWLRGDESEQMTGVDPFPTLLNLPAMDRPTAADQMEVLQRVPLPDWLAHSSKQRLKETESLFFLSRENRRTENWWLFNGRGSVLMDRIRWRLAVVQQIL